jgi:putative FmdB family regulatory protein
MPTYDFFCKKCDHRWEELLSIAKMDIPLNEPCPSCKSEQYIERTCESPLLVDPVRLGLIKPPSDFREVLRKIQKNNPHHTMVRDR